MTSLPGDEFFEVTGTLEYEEYGGYSIGSSLRSGDQLELRILLDTGISDALAQEWLIRCTGAVAHELHLTNEIDFPKVLDNHPLLWAHTKPRVTLWFYSPAEIEPNAVIGRLFEAHVSLVGSDLMYGEFLNSLSNLRGLIAGRHGS